MRPPHKVPHEGPQPGQQRNHGTRGKVEAVRGAGRAAGGRLVHPEPRRWLGARHRAASALLAANARARALSLALRSSSDCPPAAKRSTSEQRPAGGSPGRTVWLATLYSAHCSKLSAGRAGEDGGAPLSDAAGAAVCNQSRPPCFFFSSHLAQIWRQMLEIAGANAHEMSVRPSQQADCLASS